MFKASRFFPPRVTKTIPAPRTGLWPQAREKLDERENLDTAARTPTLGWFPALTVGGALGLLLVALAFNGSRAGAGWAQLLFWLGLLVLFVPIAFRLITVAPTRVERLALVIFLGLALYLVKVMQNPIAFTYPDEFIHVYNVDQILYTHHLFSPNAALPVSSLYPGLSSVTSALASITGLTDFVSGLVIIGAARLVLLMSIFLLIERVSESAYIAGIATLLYMTHSNFLFFSAEFAYESLALPLALMVAYVVSERESYLKDTPRIGLAIAELIVMMAVIITHHLTAYVLIAFLLILSLLYRIVSRGKRSGPLYIGLFGLVATVEWLIFVASLTFTYLAPVLRGAITSLLGFLQGQNTARELFTSTSGAVAPIWERLIGIGSVLLGLAGLPFGLFPLLKYYRREPFALLLGGASLIYFGMLGLRFFPAAWEIGNRASEFVFIGVAFVLALAVGVLAAHTQSNLVGRLLLIAALAILFMGGLIAGWPPEARLALPYVVDADGYSIYPQGLVAAGWMQVTLGPGNRIATDPANMHFLLQYGNQFPLTGNSYGIKQMMYSEKIDTSVITILHDTETHYVLVDRRQAGWDQVVGVYFDRNNSNVDSSAEFFDPQVYGKFDRQGRVSRIFDSGDIVIYDVGALSGVVRAP